MRLCIIGIGGCGGDIAGRFLKGQDALGSYLGDRFTGGRVRGYHIPCFWGIMGTWLEADFETASKQMVFGPIDKSYPGFTLTYDIIKDDEELKQFFAGEYGFDLLSPGFFRSVHVLKAITGIFDFDRRLIDITGASPYFQTARNPILENIWNNINRYSYFGSEDDESRCDSILFIVSLGGGTGSGFINPITRYIKNANPKFPVHALGILTEKGLDPQKIPEPRRALSAAISMNDLLTKSIGGENIAGLILVDNQLLKEKLLKSKDKSEIARDYTPFDDFIFEVMKPFVDPRQYPGEPADTLAVPGAFITELRTGFEFPPILIPCYNSTERCTDVERFVANALEGRLFGCDPSRAERAFVFTRGLVDDRKIKEAIVNQTHLTNDKISIWRRLGDERDEILILLRNPYGEDRSAHEREGSFEHRIKCLIKCAMKYMKENEAEIIEPGWKPNTKMDFGTYFYGSEPFFDGVSWFDKKLEELNEKERSGSIDVDDKDFREKLARVKADLGSRDLLCLAKILDRCIGRIMKGEKPIFQEELGVFDIMRGTSREGRPRGEEERDFQKLVRREVEKILIEKGFSPGVS